MSGDKTGKVTIICVIMFLVFLGIAAWIENVGFTEFEADVFRHRTIYCIQRGMIYDVFPIFGYAGEVMWAEETTFEEELFYSEMPLFDYLNEEINMKTANEDAETIMQLTALQKEELVHITENTEGILTTPEYYNEMMSENEHAVLFATDTDFFTSGAGYVSELSTTWVTEFIKASNKTVEYDESKLSDYEFVMENFYTVDSCTSAGPDILKPKDFLEYNATIDKSQPGPHILIYHTHSQEAFIDSVPGDKSTTIVGVGEKLTELLREEYGYEVYHHTGEYDIDTRDDAYAKAAPALEEILEQYPQIQVIIDLHRDGVDENRHLVAEWEGRQIAQFMFFNGLSYLNSKGSIDYLPNPYLQGNLALSFQATVTANEYYPGLARRTYLNGYRYNMHYREKTMLIELGAQTNTVNEVMSACEPLAHILDMVFSGE